MYKYGMRLRPYGIGCQPKGVVKDEESNKTKSGYHWFIWYAEKLTDEQEWSYDLDFIAEE